MIIGNAHLLRSCAHILETLSYDRKRNPNLIAEVEEHVEYFFMGSCRFGYESDDSDLDVCIRSFGPQGLEKDSQTLGGLRAEEIEHYREYGDHVYRQFRLQGVDIVLIPGAFIYSAKENQHLRLELAFKSSEQYANIYEEILNMKKAKVQGNNIYRFLVATLLREEAI